MDESTKQDKNHGYQNYRGYIEQVDEVKGRAITRGGLLTRRLSWQPSVETGVEIAEVSRRHSSGKKKKNREGLNMNDAR